MIYLYSGTPGSGKSLHQAERIYNRLRAGKPVIANYEINTGVIRPRCRGEFTYVDNDNLTPDFLKSYAMRYFQEHKFREGAIWLFIDEAQILFNARAWQAKGRSDWTAFFTQHRKYGYDIYFVSQFDRMLDRQIRSLIEYEVIHRKVSNFGVRGKLISLCSGGQLFVAVTMWYPMGEKTGSEFFKFHKRYQKLYDSYKDFGNGFSAAAPKDMVGKTGKEAFKDEEVKRKMKLALASST